MRISPFETGKTALTRFEELTLPHLDAAYNLARWLVKNEQDAEDIVQEAYMRAFKFFATFRGDNARTWLLAIVRNTSYTWLKENRSGATTPFDENIHGDVDGVANQESKLVNDADALLVRQALNELPLEFREVMVLREMEGLSYKEISEMANVPLGTVMSRLARARKWLQDRLASRLKKKEA